MLGWNKTKALDKLRRMLAASQDPATARKWGPQLHFYCEELSQQGAEGWSKRRNETLQVLLEAAPYFAVHGMARNYLEWIGPLMVDPPRALVDDVYTRLTEPILQGGGFGAIDEALRDLFEFSRRHTDAHHWVAFAKALAASINALYTLRRFATADGLHEYFERIPAKFRNVVRVYESQAILDQALWHGRDGDGHRVANSVAKLEALAKEHAAPPLRHNFAAGVVALIPELVEAGKIDECIEQGEKLWKLVRTYPEDVELASEYLHFLAEALPALLHADEAGPHVERARELVELFRRQTALGEKASELLLALAEEQPQVLAEKGAALLPLLQVLERRFGRRSPLLYERCRQVRERAGLPPPSGCLFAVVVVVALGLLA